MRTGSATEILKKQKKKQSFLVKRASLTIENKEIKQPKIHLN